jgi:hypothetical protein
MGTDDRKTRSLDRGTIKKAKTVMNENEEIIDLVSKQAKLLLYNHWPDISDFRDGDESIKVGFSSLIQYQGQERVVETTISFGKRVKDSTVERINTEQMDLDLAAPAQTEMAAPAKKRGRPKGSKNILQKALSNAPSRQPEAA